MASHDAFRESATKNRALRHVGRAVVIALLGGALIGGPVNGAFADDDSNTSPPLPR
ncbi:hypothetical protein [Streptomyces mirabilis]|uniref:hypothetical protein n=1 Tax=Streptomyces mirabilis TaxID=68239 RepID=UPI0036BA278D